MRDKRFPILFLFLAIVLTFGTFLVSSLIPTITGGSIGTFFSGWTAAWIILLIFAIFIGAALLLHEEKY